MAQETVTAAVAAGLALTLFLAVLRVGAATKRHATATAWARQVLEFAAAIEGDPDRRPRMRALLEQERGKHSDWYLVVLADRFLWPTWVVTCLPHLHFVLSRDSGVYWKQALGFIPPMVTRYRILRTLCNGEVMCIRMEHSMSPVANELAEKIEDVRRAHPYQSERSLIAAVNGHIAYCVRITGDEVLTDISSAIDINRRQVLGRIKVLP